MYKNGMKVIIHLVKAGVKNLDMAAEFIYIDN